MAPPKIWFCPNLGVCYVTWQRGVQVANGIDAVIQVIFKEGGYSDGPIIITGSLQVQEVGVRGRGAVLPALQVEEGAASPELPASSIAERQGSGLSPRTSRRKAALQTL